jgi:hypothetical protein
MSIAAEQLVAAETRDDRLEAEFTRRLADEPGIDPVDRRLVHRVENSWQIGVEFRFRHGSGGVPAAVLCRQFARDRRLIRTRVAKLVIAQRDRVNVPLTEIAHQAEQGPRIDPGRQERTNRDISDEMMADAVEQRGAHLRRDVEERRRFPPFGRPERLRDREIA